MTIVKPSKQEDLMVVPYRPYRRFFVVFALLLTFLGAVGGSFFLGRYYAIGSNSDIAAAYDRYKVIAQEKTAESEQFQQQVANMRLAAEVDRKATEEVRAEVVALKTKLAELEQDNSFYRGLMRPAPGDKGLVVDPPAVSVTTSAGVYKYNVLIKQIATQHNQVQGHLEFTLSGKQGDRELSLPLKDISSAYDTEQIKLNFKYFQRIDGEMTLPEDFVPERIDLKIVARKPSSVVIEKKFGWLLKEG